MKKSFYFALALTAGLFASCSSDDLTAQAPLGPEVNENEAAQIKIGVANVGVGVTRGTGTVGTTDATTNAWAGQKFNLFMFKKGTLEAAQKTVGGADVDIYNNAELTAPTTAAGTSSGQATYVIGEEEQFDYYPTTGAYSFWGYRADDAADYWDDDSDPTTPDVPKVRYTDANGTDATAATGTQVRIPFTIDGSQDIMLATPDEAGDGEDLRDYSATDAITNTDEAAEKIYTAFSARRGINPTLKFKHALTRLVFQIKASDISVSDKADLVGAADYRGFKVTEISVKSHNKGEVIAANLVASGTTMTNGAQSVVFDQTAALTDMLLKSRPKKMSTFEVGDFSAVLAVTYNATTGAPTYAGNFVHTDAANNVACNATTAALKQYTTSDEVDEYSGKPVQELQTLSSIIAAKMAADPTATSVDVYHWHVTTPGVEDVSGVDAPASAKLIALKPVVPTCTGATASYEWEIIPQTVYDAVVAADATMKIADDVDNASATAAAVAAARAAAVAADAGKVVKITGTNLAAPVYLRNAEKFTLGAGSLDPTPIGEALLLEPGVGSYEMTIKYKRWKKTSTNAFSEVEGTLVKEINHPTGTFLASNSYKVLITLYSDGNVTTDTDLDPWTDTNIIIPVEGEE